MKNNLFILAAILLLGAGGYFGYYHFATADASSMLCAAGGEMEWLRKEFKLDDGQFKKIRELHEAYRPQCDRMCEKIAASRARLDRLIDTNRSVTSEVESAFKEYALSEEECRQAMLGHIYEVSAVMSRENGARYLQIMKEYILKPSGASHTALRVDQHH